MLRYFLLILSLLLPGLAAAEGRTMIVLDASGSMWGQIDGKTKVEIARETLADVLGKMPAETELGLVAYGHRNKGDCGDIEVAVEAAPGTADQIIAFANETKFLGKTPLSDAVKIAADSLRSTEEKATVILVTDGLETCGGDPCALGTALEQSGVDFTAHVVGFGLSDEEGKQVACLAENTGGKYLAAADATELADALTQTVAVVEPAPEPEPEPTPEPAVVEFNLIGTTSLAEGGEMLDADVYWEVVPVVDGKVSDDTEDYTYNSRYRTSLEPGDYVIRARIGGLRAEEQVTLTADKTTEVHFTLNGAIISLIGVRSEGAEEDGDIYVEMVSGDYTDYGYGHVTGYVPAGEIVLNGRQAKAEATKTITVAPGDIVEEEIVVGSGIVGVSALYAAGGPAVESDIYFEILGAAKKLDGSRDSFAYTYGPGQLDVPAGEYILYAKIGEAEAFAEPFTVGAGERVDVELVMNAGVAAITAPGTAGLEVFYEKKDINGNRKGAGYSYNAEYQTTLPAGKYVVVSRYDEDKPEAEVTFEVIAGERTEVTVP